MASSTATTVVQYLAELPPDRRAEIGRVRDTVNANLPEGYVERMLYGMIAWCVPLKRYSGANNGQPIGVAALASQKQYMALYLGTYLDRELETWFKRAYAATGKKLDMGKSCVRFKSVDALALDVIAETIRKVPVDALIAHYEAAKTPRRPKAKAKTKTKPKAKPKAKKRK